MAHTFRFFVPTELIPDEKITLEGEEAHHALHVARVKEGETVHLINGAGACAIGHVQAVERTAISVSVESVEHASKPDANLHLWVGRPNREKTVERIIELCVPLGATRIGFFRAEHSERAPNPGSKWERWAREACKQCGRLWLPELTTAPSLAIALEQERGRPLLAALVAAETAAIPEPALQTRSCALFIGPEAGFSSEETELLETADAVPMRIAEHVLRTEVACAAAAAVLSHAWLNEPS